MSYARMVQLDEECKHLQIMANNNISGSRLFNARLCGAIWRATRRTRTAHPIHKGIGSRRRTSLAHGTGKTVSGILRMACRKRLAKRPRNVFFSGWTKSKNQWMNSISSLTLKTCKHTALNVWRESALAPHRNVHVHVCDVNRVLNYMYM